MTGNCYLFEPYVYKTWADAEFRCNIGGGYLVSISGVEEMSYINSKWTLFKKIDGYVTLQGKERGGNAQSQFFHSCDIGDKQTLHLPT